MHNLLVIRYFLLSSRSESQFSNSVNSQSANVCFLSCSKELAEKTFQVAVLEHRVMVTVGVIWITTIFSTRWRLLVRCLWSFMLDSTRSSTISNYFLLFSLIIGSFQFHLIVLTIDNRFDNRLPNISGRCKFFLRKSGFLSA